MILDSVRNSMTFSVDLTVHVVILLTILTIFYIMYIRHVVQHHIDHEYENIIETNISSMTKDLSSNQINTIRKLREYLPLQKLTEINNKKSDMVTNNNNWTLKYMITINICFALLMIVILLMVKVYTHETNEVIIGEILKENAIVFTFIGIVEFVFFYFVASKYIPIMPSESSMAILDALSKKLSDS